MSRSSENFNESLVAALCQSIYSGNTIVAGGAFQSFLFPSDGLASLRIAIDAIRTVSQQNHGSWESVEIALKAASPSLAFGDKPFVQILLRYQDRLEAGIRELVGHRISDGGDYLRCLLREASKLVSEDISIDAIAAEFGANMRKELVEAGTIAHRMMTTNANLIRETFDALKSRLAKPNAAIVGLILKLLISVLSNVLIARDAFLNSQLPVIAPLAIIDAVSRNKMIEKDSLRFARSANIPPTIEIPGYIGKTLKISDSAQRLLDSCKSHIENSIVSPVIAARIWAFFVGPKQLRIEGGGAIRSESIRPILGGAAKDAHELRSEENSKFGRSIAKIVKELAQAIDSIGSNTSKDLISFLADGATRPLIVAFNEIKFPSKAYIPILSGYYRTPEAAARRARYLETLGNLVVMIEKIAGPSVSKLDGASRNAFSKCRGLAKEMIRIIEESNRHMSGIFAKLASGQIAEVTAGDTVIANGLEAISSDEAGGQSGEEFDRLTKALEKLRAAAHIASTKNNILSGIDKIDEYLSKGKKICEKTIKNRMDELSLTYRNIVERVDPEVKELAKKVIEFKMNVYQEFYGILAETELYLTKSHKAFIASPAVRDELYRAIAGWTLATQSSETLKGRFRDEIEKLLKIIFPNDPSKDIFRYVANSLEARRLGHGIVAAQLSPTDGQATKERTNDDNKMYDNFRRHLMQSLNLCPQLHLVFRLVNIIEKTFGREYDSKKLYSAAVHFIAATAVDVCQRSEALSAFDVAEMDRLGYHPIGRYGAGAANPDYVMNRDGGINYYPIGSAAGAGNSGVAAAFTERLGRTAQAATGEIGVFFRHAIGKLRLEDEIFVRWMKAICANLLLALDRDRATHGVDKIRLPGAERLLIGGMLDDPIGLTGSTHVIPDAVPLYRGFLDACGAYEDYFSWDASKLHWSSSDEPRLIIEVPRSSRFYIVLEHIRRKKGGEVLSETYIAQLGAAINDIWAHYAAIADPKKRVSAIMDAFLDEINNSIMLQMLLDHSEAEAQRELEADREAITGVGLIEDRLEKIPRSAESKRQFRRKILNALKGIAMSVYDIMSKVGMSETAIANDYKASIDRIQKRIADLPDKDRFRELVRTLQNPDESVGDIQGLFMAFTEFVATPLFLIESVTESFVYRAANLYIMILRYLYSARIWPNIANRGITYAGVPPVGIGIARPVGGAARVAIARSWFLYGDNAAKVAATDWSASHQARVDYVLDHMEIGSLENVNLQADANHFKAFHQGTSKYFIHMHQPIYKAIQLLLDVGKDLVEIKGEEADPGARPARILKLQAAKFIAFIVDSLTDLKAAIGPFMKIGKKEFSDRYFHDLTSWDPKAMLEKVCGDVNRALGIVHCDFAVLREYLPTAVCYSNGWGTLVAQPAGQAGGWVVNFLRNAIRSDDNAKALISYHETIQYVIGRPWEWGSLALTSAARVGGHNATAIYQADWKILGDKRGIFSPIVRIGNKIGPTSGKMPWTNDDLRVIEEGISSAPGESIVQVGPALNTPILYRQPIANGIGLSVSSDYQVMNSGGWYYGDRASNLLAAGNHNGTIGFQRIDPRTLPAIRAVGSGSIVQSAIYGGPGFGTKAETLNRLLAKMASCLTIQGESPVILYELASEMSANPGLSIYFRTEEITIVSAANRAPTITYTFFPETIGTPCRYDSDWSICYGNGLAISYAQDPANLGANIPTNAQIHGVAADGSICQTFKPGVFLYDIAISPFYYSTVSRSTKRVAEMSNAEMAKYLAAIPQFLIAFKALLHQIIADREIAPRPTMAGNPCGWPSEALAAVAQAPANIHPMCGDGVVGEEAFTHIAFPTDTDAIPAKMEKFIEGLIDCLSSCYRTIRERYGNPVHAEMVKGNFDPYLTAGKFDPTKLTTPISSIIGMALVDQSGPVMLAGFGERGHANSETALAFSWATPVIHKKLTNMEVISLDSIPWTVALAERLKKITHASIDTILQPLITRIALLACVQNRMNLTSLACHNPWTTHSVPSMIFHPHILDLHIASMEAKFDLLRAIDHAHLEDASSDNHYLAESSLPWLSSIPAASSFAETVFHANILGAGNAGEYLGPWAIAPFPITYDVNNTIDRIENMIKSTFTGNPYQPKAAIKGIELYKPADAVNGRILDPSVARTVIANAATRRFLDRGTIPIGDRYIHGGVVGAGIHFDQPGALIAAILHQMRSNDYEKQWLKNAKKYLLDRFPGFNPTVSEATDKREASWTLNRTKPKKLIEKQIGLKIGEGIYDANYIELIRFSPPKDRWIDDLKADERRMVGFFMHIKRNPVTILSAIRLTPFPSIYGFSEAFDLYFQLAASRSKKTFQESRVRSHVPSLITEPTSLSRYYVDFSAPNRKGNTFLLTDANAWTESSKPYAERERARVRVNRAAFAANAPINDDDQNAYQSIKPIYRNSSIEDFYNVRTTINDDPIGFCAPSNQAVVKNRSYTPFPIFAMYIRMLDQYGVTLKGELATRLGEIKYDRPETLAQYQDAMVNILNSK